MASDIKICGIGTADSVEAAAEVGATMIGLVFFGPSPRNLSLAQGAALARLARGRLAVVALTVDSDDALLALIAAEIRPDLLQLHGRETPDRARIVAERFGIPVMKAVGIAAPQDLETALSYAGSVDRLLLDGKPPPDASRPGGNAARFDWRLAAGFDPGVPWLLSGGLAPENVAEALAVSGAPGVDVSSGVESAPGVKDTNLIRAFVAAARQAGARRPHAA